MHDDAIAKGECLQTTLFCALSCRRWANGPLDDSSREEKGTPAGVVYRAQGWAAGRTGLPRPPSRYSELELGLRSLDAE
eukprot:1195344-Prorocentrum_minimum.AAC.5